MPMLSTGGVSCEVGVPAAESPGERLLALCQGSTGSAGVGLLGFCQGSSGSAGAGRGAGAAGSLSGKALAAATSGSPAAPGGLAGGAPAGAIWPAISSLDEVLPALLEAISLSGDPPAGAVCPTLSGLGEVRPALLGAMLLLEDAQPAALPPLSELVPAVGVAKLAFTGSATLPDAALFARLPAAGLLLAGPAPPKTLAAGDTTLSACRDSLPDAPLPPSGLEPAGELRAAAAPGMPSPPNDTSDMALSSRFVLTALESSAQARLGPSVSRMWACPELWRVSLMACTPDTPETRFTAGS